MIHTTLFTRLTGTLFGIVMCGIWWLAFGHILASAFLSIAVCALIFIFFDFAFGNRFMKKDFFVNFSIPYIIGIAVCITFIILFAEL